jgi:hypothetical protein
LVAFIFGGPPPPSITVAGKTVSTSRVEGMWTVYQVAPTPTGPLTITFAGPVSLRANSTAHDGQVSFVTPGSTAALGAPDLRVYCPHSDPEGYRFQQLYAPEHPFGLSLGMLLAWPVVDEVLAAALVVLALVVVARARDDLF